MTSHPKTSYPMMSNR